MRLHCRLHFARAIAVAFRRALVVLLLALGQADLAFHAAALVVQVEWYQGVSGAFHLADQFIHFRAVQQQLARTYGFRMDVGRGGRQGADMRAEQEEFIAADDDVGFLDLYAGVADGLLPSLPARCPLRSDPR